MSAVAAASPGYAAPARQRWAMAIRGFICQNVLIGAAYGGFGVAMVPMQHRYGVGAGTVTLALSLAVLTLGLASPLTGVLIARFGLRPTMAVGAVLSALGYGLLAFAPDIGIVLAAYGLLVGSGLALCGNLAQSVLVSNWFQPSPGRAIGFVNMSVAVALFPPVALAVLERYGLQGFFLLFCVLCILLLPLIVGVADGPAGHAAVTPRHPAPTPEGASPPGLLGHPVFWIIILGAGAMTGVAILGAAHLVAFSVERGRSTMEATLLLSMMGGASALGSFVSGLLSDRLGGARMLALISAACAASWSILLLTTLFSAMSLAAIVIGACGGGIFPAVNVLVTRLFGTRMLPRALGLFGLLTLPFTFLAAPLAGMLRDYSGSYVPVTLSVIAAAAACMTVFLLLQWRTFGPRD